MKDESMCPHAVRSHGPQNSHLPYSQHLAEKPAAGSRPSRICSQCYHNCTCDMSQLQQMLTSRPRSSWIEMAVPTTGRLGSPFWLRATAFRKDRTWTRAMLKRCMLRCMTACTCWWHTGTLQSTCFHTESHAGHVSSRCMPAAKETQLGFAPYLHSCKMFPAHQTLCRQCEQLAFACSLTVGEKQHWRKQTDLQKANSNTRTLVV